MTSNDDFSEDFRGLILKGVVPLGSEELGRGAYGRVYKVKYCELMCAAKEIHSILIEGVNKDERAHIVRSFFKECHQCSQLRHPNIIQFMGVYYPSQNDSAATSQLPVMVMEMMSNSLTKFVENCKIPDHTKFSIVHDVSLGLCYLHGQDQPIVHRDLSPNNVLLTAHHVAKISDLGVARVIKADSRRTQSNLTKVPGTVDFMPPEATMSPPDYGTPMDVFSFAGIVLHTFNQCWPTPERERRFDSETRTMVGLLETERRQKHLKKMTGAGIALKPLVEQCLDCDPARRPIITSVCETIRSIKGTHAEKPIQDAITIDKQQEQLQIDSSRKKLMEETVRLKKENETLKEKVKIQAAQNPIQDPITRQQQVEQLQISNDQKKLIEEMLQLRKENETLKEKIKFQAEKSTRDVSTQKSMQDPITRQQMEQLRNDQKKLMEEMLQLKNKNESLKEKIKIQAEKLTRDVSGSKSKLKTVSFVFRKYLTI